MQFLKLILKLIILIEAKKTRNTSKQNPVCNGYYIASELYDVSEKGYYESNLRYVNVDWFVDEIFKLEKKGFLF